MKKERIFFVFAGLMALFLFLGGVSATVGVSLSAVNSTFSVVTISGADHLYGYEVNLDYSGASGTYSVAQAKFVGSTDVATYGSSSRSGIISVYGSKLESSGTGVSGSGTLFNISHTGGSVSLRSLIGLGDISTGSREDIVYYNVSAEEEDSGSGGSSSSSSSSAGGSTPSLSVTLSSEEIEMDVVAGYTQTQEITLENTGATTLVLNAKIFGIEGIAEIEGGNTITIPPGQSVTVNITIDAPDSGIEAGKIVFTSPDGASKEATIVVNTKSADALFDVALSVPKNYKSIAVGGSAKIFMSLLQVSEAIKVDVIATYFVKDFEGNVFLTDTETFYVEKSKDFGKEFDLSSLPEGNYIIGVEVVYPGGFATSSEQIVVGGRQEIDWRYYIFGGLLLIVIAVIIYSVVGYRKTGEKKVSIKEKKK